MLKGADVVAGRIAAVVYADNVHSASEAKAHPARSELLGREPCACTPICFPLTACRSPAPRAQRMWRRCNSWNSSTSTRLRQWASAYPLMHHASNLVDRDTAEAAQCFNDCDIWDLVMILPRKYPIMIF
jgi:hypothetical protein